MALVALTGDCTTTTAVALAAAWPVSDQVLLLEADPRGGSLAGWFDLPLSPSLSTLVAAAHGSSAEDGTASEVDLTPLIRSTPTGIWFVPAPFRSREATRAIAEARHHLFPRIFGDRSRVTIADLGEPIPGGDITDRIGSPDVTVICHRQDHSSPSAAAVRLERLREQLESAAAHALDVVVAIIGSEPFDCAQIAEHLDPELTWVEMAVDPLAAAVHAGRLGVSERRLARLPLSRSARHLADAVRSVGQLECEAGHQQVNQRVDQGVDPT